MSTYFDYTFIEPGGSVASLDTVITAIETSLNDLPVEAVPWGALNRDHFASDKGILTNVQGTTLGDLTINQWTVGHTYQEGTRNIDYSAYGTDGATDRHLIGDTTSYTGAEAVIDGFAVNLGANLVPGSDKPDVQAFWVKGNVQVNKVTGGGTDITSVMICAQIGKSTTAGGAITWHTLDRTERFVSTPDHSIDGDGDNMHVDVAIKTIVTSADVGNNWIRGVRLMVSAGGPVTGTARVITLGRWNLTALPIRIGSQ